MNSFPTTAKERLELVINQAWYILYQRILSGRQEINKEASMQLQLARIMSELGSAYCIKPNEVFSVELETGIDRKSIDITCSLGIAKAALELKCFRKKANRAKDTDMYDVLRDIERLDNYTDFDIKKFICLTDNSYYASYKPKGLARSVMIQEGTKYFANIEITPAWKNKWKVHRDTSIKLLNDLTCIWENDGEWYYMMVNR